MIPISLAVPLAFFFQAQPTYTIAGTVVDSVTGAVISKAIVSVSGIAAPVITGKDGAFRFDGLKAGKYQLHAQRLGYVAQFYAQRALHQNLTTGIVTGEHESTGGIVFRMIPSAVIAGYVRDSIGEPVVEASIQVIRIIGIGRNRHLGTVVSTSTDDRGYYRVRSLAAGNYAVVATGRGVHEIASVQPMAYPVTFYPGTTDPSGAGFIHIQPGEEGSGDMTVYAVPAMRIEGEVPSAASPAWSGLYVAIMAPSLFGNRIASNESVNVLNGKFTIPNVPAGKYHLTMMRQTSDGQSTQVAGGADLTVNANPSKISISEAPQLRISVHLAVIGRPKFPSSPLQAILQQVDVAASTAARVGADGRAVFSGYRQPGRYTILVNQGRPLAVTALKVASAAQSGLVFEMPETGTVDIEAVADASTVDVAGRLVRGSTPQSGVLAILVQRDTWEQIGIYRSDQSDSDGTFAWRDVPPGEYLAFALEDGEPNDYDDVDTLRALLPIAQPLTITDAAVQHIDLKLLPQPVAK
ncbi:MAG: carboxypeptidase-like regulatory domain-containing protein [Acidobacteriia bacterium]|nr:carboxypeptidase-like regulatory domain-containing protein [Terriglobia bacterium]